MPGVLISFEGIDGSGKNTQSTLLRDSLRSHGYKVEFLSFPDYATQIGREISSFLSGARNYTLETRHMLYAANRYEHKDEMEKWLLDNRIVLVNRYSESNIAYGVASGLPMAWLKELEERMPKANYTFLLKAPPELSRKRIERKRDLFEENERFLARVVEVYDALAEAGKWFVLDATREKDSLHYEISQLTERLLKETPV